jgi:hypothetical protein
VVAILPVDEPGQQTDRPPVAERDETQDLPEGVLAWLAQLQPLPGPLSRPSMDLKDASGAKPEKISAAIPRVTQAQAGVSVQGPMAARGGLSIPMGLAGGPTVAMAASALAQANTPATQLPAPPGAMERARPSAIKPVPLLATTPAIQLPAVPVSDVLRLPGSGSVALAESPVQPLPESAAEPGATPADRDTPPPQSTQPLPPGLERTARAQATPQQAAFNPSPAGKPEVPGEKAPQPYLQVPFSKADCAGLVTINKAPADMPQQLVLSPSNAQVSAHLRDGLEQVPQSLWQLNEQHQQGRGDSRQHDTDDDEPHGDAPRALASMPALQGLQS